MSSLIVSGDTSGAITVSAPAAAGSGTLTLPTGTDTLVGKATTDTLTNKTLTSPVLTTPNLGTPSTLVLTNATGLAAAAMPAGSIIQIVNYTTGALATGTTILPWDDTIPQNTEGTQFLSLAITPTSATNKLFIQVMILCTHSIDNWMTVALFQDSTANALGAMSSYQVSNTGGITVPVNHYMTSGTTSSTTFKVRAGSHNAGTTTFNGQNGARTLGGYMNSSITITEIKV